MNRLLLLFVFFTWQSHVLLKGQISFPENKLFTVNEGLSQSHVNTLLQDSRGFLWVGTENGLSRYDGYEFVNYTHQPYDTNSLSNNCVNAICEDSQGILWIATNKGLNSYDIKRGIFTSYTYDSKNSSSISDDKVLNVYIDSKKTIWVKTLKSLDEFDPKTRTFRKYVHYYDLFRFISGNIPFPILEDKENRLWVGTKDGLMFFDRDLQLFNRYICLEYNGKSLSHDEVRSICEDKDGSGTIWIGTANGLNAFDPTKKEFQRFYPEPNTKTFISSNHINAIYQEKPGLFWVGTNGGLFIFNRNERTFAKVYSRNNISLNVPVSSIIKDRSGVIWVGTLKGLMKINSKKTKFKLYRSGENPGYSFTSNDIGALYSPDNERLMIGTSGAGLNILNRRTNTVINYDFSKNGTDENNSVNDIFEFSNDKYLLGTNNGILIFNTLSGDYVNLSEAETSPGFEALLQNKINSIVRDSKGRIWIGTFHGLYRLNPDLKTMKSYVNEPDNSNSLANSTVQCLVMDRKNNLWVGTENGLDCFETEAERFTHFDGKKLSSTSIYSLKFDSEGELWVGTASGLNRVNLTDKKPVKILTERDGISDNLIYALLIDDKQTIWISTNHGINRIDPTTYQIRTFDVYDGLQDYEFKHNVACKNRKGELFFGGVAGVNSFYPDSLDINKFVPPVIMTSVDIINAKGKKESLNPFAEKIIIPYRTHIFTINFAALDFTLPEKNNFSYKFYSDKEGEWINLGNKHSATFSNLKPGEYYLKVKGSNNDLIWNDEGLTTVIIIESPFWLKTEAYYLYIFMCIITILVIYRYRTYHLRKANRILKEREVAAREIELQKEQLAIKNKNITDSINYAKRIQEALMPSEKSFKKILPESFIFHQPKDIVSGDFFWVSERGNKIFVAAVDCTGHGVPGAFMSIIGFELFRKITHSQGVDDPSKILNILNHEFEEIFRDVDNFTLRDGMDIAFCVIDKQTKILEFSGAVNPIYLIRDNKITEIRGSRFSVGLDDNFDEDQSFENKQILLQEDDVIYLFSDGYADQFGGPEGKKFKYRRFRHLLLTIHQYPMEEQQRLLEERINRWKGSSEQVDDILVIGFRPIS
jgi:ligand-binding sensor domain-containing protein/serine phosphatase RsbU (regulator of sigma subunit)